ncbi:hypothetical protein [Mucilaginibacter terrae]|uniref:DUF1735 domain-containing protein n=1 Tax=Mucilaginibacter terrae TaxID=1955052 RepID=A0ABU3GU43_9SPHI|nr:hypothetical protein [Mucilaginibacter terrae]MDT3402981.1 hypothetical protein [Mucilaginibacter terrae]
MKKLLIYSLAVLSFMASCRKSDNPKLEGVERVPLPQLTVNATADQVIKSDAPDAFVGKFTVGLYFPDDVKPSKMDIVVIKNGDQKNVQVLQSNVTTFPTEITVRGTQFKSLFGNVSSILGDSYTIGANITTQDGKVYPAFSGVANQNNSNIASLAGATPTITYGALCGFHMEDYGAIGSTVPYTVVADGWQDYAVGSTIPVKIIDATHLSFVYGVTDNVQPIVITIDPATNKTSVTKQVYGNYGDGLNFSAASVAGSADNQVLPCQLTVGVRLAHTSSAGSYGSFTITLKKK